MYVRMYDMVPLCTLHAQMLNKEPANSHTQRRCDIDDVSMIPPQSPAHVGDQPVNQSTWQGSRDGTRSSHCKHDI